MASEPKASSQPCFGAPRQWPWRQALVRRVVPGKPQPSKWCQNARLARLKIDAFSRDGMCSSSIAPSVSTPSRRHSRVWSPLWSPFWLGGGVALSCREAASCRRHRQLHIPLPMSFRSVGRRSMTRRPETPRHEREWPETAAAHAGEDGGRKLPWPCLFVRAARRLEGSQAASQAASQARERRALAASHCAGAAGRDATS